MKSVFNFIAKLAINFIEPAIVLAIMGLMLLNPLYFAIWLSTSLTLLIVTYALYSSIMYMDIKQDELYLKTPLVRWTCYVILFAGLVFDTLLDWIFLTFTYYELPREFLSTARIRRHKFNSSGFRQIQSLWWCHHWLMPFDAKHCEE